MDALALVITSAITLVGLYLAHNLRRQQRLRIAEQRVTAYRQLWNLMEIARPSRLDPCDGMGPMTRQEASKLYHNITAWYFDAGNGMMLTDATAKMYLGAKSRLAQFAAVDGDADDPQWRKRSERRIRELSLLRTQMKSDLAIYGRFYPGSLDADDERFVRSCGLDPKRWARPPLARLRERFTTSRAAGYGPRFPGSGTPDAPPARD
jgi:hypothetical protein